MSNLGFITPQITMSLGDGLDFRGPFGYITPGITTMLGDGSDVRLPHLVGADRPGMLPTLVGFGQDPAAVPEGSASKIVFGLMLLGLGVSLGFAIGVSHGVKVAR